MENNSEEENMKNVEEKKENIAEENLETKEDSIEEDLNLDDVLPKKQIKITLTTWIKFFVGFCMVAVLAIVLIAYKYSTTKDTVKGLNNSEKENYESVNNIDENCQNEKDVSYESNNDVTESSEKNGEDLLNRIQSDIRNFEKPIIYIYPEKEIEVEVKLERPENLTSTYPKYENNQGWKVLAKPNGELTDLKTGRNLYALYWEGKKNKNVDNNFKEGFIVEGENTAEFLEEKLSILGLNEREAEEFIIYWLPQMEGNKYNYIRFESKEEINENMPLEVNPKPETLIRVMMEWKGLNEKIEIKEQELEKVQREGYTIVEWGGTVLN